MTSGLYFKVVGDFSGTAYGGTPTWSDVTQLAAAGGDWDPFEFTKWRQDQVSDPTPTQISFKFFNPDARFTPGFTGLVRNLLTPDLAAPGCVTKGVTNIAPTLGGSVTAVIDKTQQLPTGPMYSLKVGLPASFTSGFSATQSVKVTCSGSTAMSFAAMVNATGCSVGVDLMVVFFNSSGTQVGSSYGSTVTHGTIGYSTLTVTSPSTAVSYTLASTPSANPAAATAYYIGNFCTVTGSTVAEETVAPYYPGVRRRTRVQIQALVGSSTIPVCDTFADAWSTTRESSTLWSTQYTGTDIIGRMGADTPLRGFLTEEMVLDSPLCLYPLQEAEGSTTFGDITGQCQPATIGNSTSGAGAIDTGQTPTGEFVAGDMVAVTNDSYSTWTGGQAAGSWLSLPLSLGDPVSADFTIECWVQFPTTAPASSAAIIYGTFFGPGSAVSLLNVSSSGQIQLYGSDNLGIAPLDGNIHQVVIVNSQALARATVCIDGVPIGFVGGGVAFQSPISLGMGPLGLNGSGYTSGTPGLPFTGGFAFFAAFPSALTFTGTGSANRVLSHYLAGSVAFAGERTDVRVARLMSYRANLGSVLDVGKGYVGSQDCLGQTLADALLATSQTEGGFLFADGQNRVNFRNRARLFNPSSVYSFDAQQGHIDTTSEIRDDIQFFIDDVSITTPDGATQRYFDQGSVTQDGDATYSATLNIDTDEHALDAAGWIVSYGKQEWLGLPSYVIDLLKIDSATCAAVLALEPLDVITLTNLGTPAPASTMTQMVQGITFSLASDAMTATLFCAPVPPTTFAWDSDAAHGWNSTAVWAY